ncbi:MAG: efflux RND transporter periplasmic adaptor subunit, partial [bacterium]
EKGELPNSDAPVRVQIPHLGNISRYARYNTILEPFRQVDIFSRISGIVSLLLIEENKRVEQGEVLAILDDSEQKLQVARNRAEVEHQRSELERARTLHQKGMLPDEELRRLELAYQSATLALEQAELLLSYTRITAPFRGIVIRRWIEIGQKVDPSKPLFTIMDDQKLYLSIWVSEEEAKKMKEVKQVEVITSSDTTQIYQATLDRISSVVDPNYGKIKATFTLKPPPNSLIPGQFVEVRLTLETHPSTLLILKKALQYESGEPYVFTIKEGKAKRSKLSLGLSRGGEVEVLSGVTQQDTVIIEGQTTLRDGTKVRIVE